MCGEGGIKSGPLDGPQVECSASISIERDRGGDLVASGSGPSTAEAILAAAPVAEKRPETSVERERSNNTAQDSPNKKPKLAGGKKKPGSKR